jgi:hypothetical protein
MTIARSGPPFAIGRPIDCRSKASDKFRLVRFEAQAEYLTDTGLDIEISAVSEKNDNAVDLLFCGHDTILLSSAESYR